MICAGTRSAVGLRQVGDAALLLEPPALGAALGAVGVEVEARDEVEEVLPGALVRPSRKPASSSRRMSSSGSVSTNATSSASRSRATPVAMFTRLCVFELTKYIGRSASPSAASLPCTGAHQRRVMRA